MIVSFQFSNILCIFSFTLLFSINIFKINFTVSRIPQYEFPFNKLSQSLAIVSQSVTPKTSPRTVEPWNVDQFRCYSLRHSTQIINPITYSYFARPSFLAALSHKSDQTLHTASADPYLLQVCQLPC